MARILDIDNIKNSPVLLEPWEHKIIDNFFPQDVFEKIQKTAIELSSKFTIPKKTNPMWMPEVLEAGGSPETVDLVIDATDDILDNIEDIMSDFEDYQTSAQGYYAMPKFGISGKGFNYPVHTESNHKVLLFVIYMFPDNDIGTSLYSSQEESSFYKSVEWKPNRAFMMAPKNEDVTWHNWSASVNPSRTTLNIFCEKMEVLSTSMLKSGNHDQYEDVLWLYKKFAEGRLTSNKI